ncbi:hypothetical protein PAXRUDRAFT_834395 [Paxillus rubicundulus Ve08.2h10]|uniref:Uncharacterized protein n=1 Tax=Paxillus rubicundulus Ve08.2h10 TaxID=930991 RepID=A0A0D0CTX7_9AGAM|nr:hypothetical protein PAXRUDRAFT_834395 [Paxillus rubicundulus Ve08.2h10]
MALSGNLTIPATFLPQVILVMLSDPASNGRRDPKRDDMRAGPNAYPAADGANVQCINLQLQEKNEVVATMQKSGVEKRRTDNAEKESPLAAAYESSVRTATRHRIRCILV